MGAIDLKEISTTPPKGLKKDEVKKVTEPLVKDIGEKLRMLHAEKKHALLIILQGMDASGKDGAIRHVFNYCSPSTISTMSFKKPTDWEMKHDFLWRVHKWVPEKGHTTIFNRSHYEDILIQRVHNWIDDDRRFHRMNAINSFEELLSVDNNTSILKFYLHISRDQQKEELQERIDEKDKHWKHNPNDWKERELWDEYMEAYNYAINNSKIPWHIIPVDKRWYRNYLMAKIIIDKLESLELTYPEFKEDA